MADLTQDLLSAETDLDYAQIRCPQCMSGYNVARADLRGERPAFMCADCHTQFWIPKELLQKSLFPVVGEFALPVTEDSGAVGVVAGAAGSASSVGSYLGSGASSYSAGADLPFNSGDALVTTGAAAVSNASGRHGVESAQSANFGHNFESTTERFNVESAADRMSLSMQDALSPITYPCPKCQEPYVAGQTECHQCGVIFRKYEQLSHQSSTKRLESVFQASKEVQSLWEDVIENYTNLDVHQNFISAAWADDALEYAALKYKQILEAVPQDEIAKKLSSEIEALTTVKFETLSADFEETIPQKIERNSFFNGLDFNFRRIGWINLIFIGCGMLIMAGFLLPHLRNLVGVGTSILFFILALRYYFKIL